MVGIINYGMGNIYSIQNALNFLGFESFIINDAKAVFSFKYLILPGVGSFRIAMEKIKEKNFDSAIKESVSKADVKMLGICLGMQLMGTSSSEDGYSEGLGLLPLKVDKFTQNEVGNRKIPHVGFNEVSFNETSSFFSGLEDKSDFYFVHSYRMLPGEINGSYATCKYGIKFLAALNISNLYGTQFHPEKSQSNGLIMINNFLQS
jgi:imidazole glycerol-phosphate synthase subunit HisH